MAKASVSLELEKTEIPATNEVNFRQNLVSNFLKRGVNEGEKFYYSKLDGGEYKEIQFSNDFKELNEIAFDPNLIYVFEKKLRVEKKTADFVPFPNKWVLNTYNGAEVLLGNLRNNLLVLVDEKTLHSISHNEAFEFWQNLDIDFYKEYYPVPAQALGSNRTLANSLKTTLEFVSKIILGIKEIHLSKIIHLPNHEAGLYEKVKTKIINYQTSDEY